MITKIMKWNYLENYYAKLGNSYTKTNISNYTHTYTCTYANRDDGTRLLPLTKSVVVSDGQRSQRSDLSERLLLALKLIYKMNINGHDKSENILLVWSTALFIDRYYYQ